MMRRETTATAWTLLLLAMIFGRLGAQAQTPATSAACPAGTDPKACGPAKHVPSVSEQFPFPGETKANEPVDPKPDQPKPLTGAQPAKDKFPYPGETLQPEAPKGDSSSSSSGEAPPNVDDKPDLKDAGTTGSTRARRRLRPPAQKILSDEERVEEDLSVAHFYQQSGNLNGAYLRAKDAVKIQPQNADGHLQLAEIAQKMGKRDEAIAAFTKYLELDPDGDGVKEARKSLEKLKP